MLTLYRVCLRLYPGDFRDDYARELTLVLRDRLRDASSAPARALILVHALLGIAMEAPLEHLRMLVADARYALRLLRRETAVTLAAVAMLALGIGAATLVFTMANAVLLRPLPFPAPERLVAIDEHTAADARSGGTVAYPNFADLRKRTRSFEQMGVYAGGKTALRQADGNEPVLMAAVSDGLLPALGVTPMLGRTFTANETMPNGPSVAILGHGLFTRRFGSDRNVIGRTLETVDGTYTIVGVMPEGFQFPGPITS